MPSSTTFTRPIKPLPSNKILEASGVVVDDPTILKNCPEMEGIAGWGIHMPLSSFVRHGKHNEKFEDFLKRYERERITEKGLVVPTPLEAIAVIGFLECFLKQDAFIWIKYPILDNLIICFYWSKKDEKIHMRVGTIQEAATNPPIVFLTVMLQKNKVKKAEKVRE